MSERKSLFSAPPFYEDEAVTIYHGDALELFSFLHPWTVSAVVTDPPYIIGAVSAGNMASKSGGWADMMNGSHWFAAWYRQVDRVLKTNACFWTFLNWRTLPVVMRAAVDAQLAITSMLVWDKEWIGPGGSQGLRPSYELCALMAKGEFAIPDRGLPDIWRCKVGSYKESGHPAEKPEPLVRRILEASALEPSSLVVDPFLGSGTTAVAAKALGLRFIGFEAEERYCEMAAKRCSQDVLFAEAAA